MGRGPGCQFCRRPARAPHRLPDPARTGRRSWPAPVLLVPYYGVGIDRPSPPANQMVLVVFKNPLPRNLEQQPLWITGRLYPLASQTVHGRAAYIIPEGTLDQVPPRTIPDAAGTVRHAEPGVRSCVSPPGTSSMNLTTQNQRERMRQALALAAQAIGLSEPNPRVGCVLAGASDGNCIGQGHTQEAGRRGACRGDGAARRAGARARNPRRHGVCHAGALLAPRPHRPVLRCPDRRRHRAGGGRIDRPEPAGRRPGPSRACAPPVSPGRCRPDGR